MHFSTYKKSKGVKVYRPKKKDCDDCPSLINLLLKEAIESVSAKRIN